VPDGVSDELAVFSEPLAAAFEIVEQLALDSSAWREQRALVLGDGKLGLLVAQVLHATGARVALIGHHAEKLAILAARGIETCLSGDFSPPTAAGGGRFDLTVDATGSAEAFALAAAATRPRGTLVLKSTVAGAHEIDLAPIVIDEINVMGSRCGPFAPALEALENGSVDVRPLVAERFPLARGDEAVRAAARRGALKVLLDCS
jgi:threonine dehydrogenase-like Zn-dependent dehydrogenase